MARVLAYGERSVLIEEISPFEFLQPLAKAIPEANVRAGLESLLITFPSTGDYVPVVEETLKNLKAEAISNKGDLFVIPVEYNGEDLETAAEQVGVSVKEIIAAHGAITWKVKLVGFAPGFPYLVPTEPEAEAAVLLAKLGRLATPRRQVPAGSVGLAAGMSCVYPSAMPGGWQLIGTSTIKLFDANNKTKPALLSIGDLVRFEQVN